MLFSCVVEDYKEKLVEFVKEAELKKENMSLIEQLDNHITLALIDDVADKFLNKYGSFVIKVFSNKENRKITIIRTRIEMFNQILEEVGLTEEYQNMEFNKISGAIFISTERLEEYELIKIKNDIFIQKVENLFFFDYKQTQKMINELILSVGVKQLYMATINDYFKTPRLSEKNFHIYLDNYDLNKNFNLVITKELYEEVKNLKLPKQFIFS